MTVDVVEWGRLGLLVVSTGVADSIRLYGDATNAESTEYMARCVDRRIVLLRDATDTDTKQVTIDDGCMYSKSVPLYVRCIAGVHRSCI